MKTPRFADASLLAGGYEPNHRQKKRIKMLSLGQKKGRTRICVQP